MGAVARATGLVVVALAVGLSLTLSQYQKEKVANQSKISQAFKERSKQVRETAVTELWWLTGPEIACFGIMAVTFADS
jgi:predicted histidine transporter YuiF (NhaC family)